jgi:hypothetical protein
MCTTSLFCLVANSKTPFYRLQDVNKRRPWYLGGAPLSRQSRILRKCDEHEDSVNYNTETRSTCPTGDPDFDDSWSVCACECECMQLIDQAVLKHEFIQAMSRAFSLKGATNLSQQVDTTPLYLNFILALLDGAVELSTESGNSDHPFNPDSVLYETFLKVRATALCYSLYYLIFTSI